MLKKIFDAIRGRSGRRQPEKNVMDGVERVVRRKCPNLLLTHKNKHQLMDGVNAAMRHFSDLIDQIPGPVELDPNHWNADPVLNAMFVDSNEIRETLQGAKPLVRFFKRPGETEAVALLTAAWHEKTVFGTAKDGEIVRRGVRQRAISFADHKLLVPASDLSKAKSALLQEALVFMCGQTFGETQDLKQWQAELEKQRDLLTFKIQPSHGRASDEEYIEEKRVLDDINQKIRSIKNNLGTSESNFNFMLRLLSNPQDMLKFKLAFLRLSRLGIVLNNASDSMANEFKLARYEIPNLTARGAIWVRVRRETMGS